MTVPNPSTQPPDLARAGWRELFAHRIPFLAHAATRLNGDHAEAESVTNALAITVGILKLRGRPGAIRALSGEDVALVTRWYEDSDRNGPWVAYRALQLWVNYLVEVGQWEGTPRDAAEVALTLQEFADEDFLGVPPPGTLELVLDEVCRADPGASTTNFGVLPLQVGLERVTDRLVPARADLEEREEVRGRLVRMMRTYLASAEGAWSGSAAVVEFLDVAMNYLDPRSGAFERWARSVAPEAERAHLERTPPVQVAQLLAELEGARLRKDRSPTLAVARRIGELVGRPLGEIRSGRSVPWLHRAWRTLDQCGYVGIGADGELRVARRYEGDLEEVRRIVCHHVSELVCLGGGVVGFHGQEFLGFVFGPGLDGRDLQARTLWAGREEVGRRLLEELAADGLLVPGRDTSAWRVPRELVLAAGFPHPLPRP